MITAKQFKKDTLEARKKLTLEANEFPVDVVLTRFYEHLKWHQEHGNLEAQTETLEYCVANLGGRLTQFQIQILAKRCLTHLKKQGFKVKKLKKGLLVSWK